MRGKLSFRKDRLRESSAGGLLLRTSPSHAKRLVRPVIVVLSLFLLTISGVFATQSAMSSSVPNWIVEDSEANPMQVLYGAGHSGYCLQILQEHSGNYLGGGENWIQFRWVFPGRDVLTRSDLQRNGNLAVWIYFPIGDGLKVDVGVTVFRTDGSESVSLDIGTFDSGRSPGLNIWRKEEIGLLANKIDSRISSWDSLASVEFTALWYDIATGRTDNNNDAPTKFYLDEFYVGDKVAVDPENGYNKDLIQQETFAGGGSPPIGSGAPGFLGFLSFVSLLGLVCFKKFWRKKSLEESSA